MLPLVYQKNNVLLTSKIFIPSLSLAFEYQGEQHYNTISMYKQNLNVRKRNDKQKAEIAKKNGITLIEIPFWWDKTESSLLATIHLHRPDLMHEAMLSVAHAVPSDMPPALKVYPIVCPCCFIRVNTYYPDVYSSGMMCTQLAGG